MIFSLKMYNIKKTKKNDQNIISSLIDKKSVCAGYARAYQYLLNRAGVQSVYIVGNAFVDELQLEREAHAWVMIHIDEDFYYSDVTWGDVENEDMRHSCYGYMLMTSDEMLRCYKPDVKYEKTKRGTFNYFKNEELYLKTFNEDKISLAVQKSLKENKRVAEFQCANEIVYNEVKNKMANTYLGYRILSQNGCWNNEATYYCNDQLLIIEIYY